MSNDLDIMDPKIKDMLVRDSILAAVALILALIMFYIAKYIFVDIQFTILGGAFMTLFGMVIGGWIYHLFFRYELRREENQ